MSEQAWMIERRDKPVWWNGTGFDARDERVWTADPNNGIRFAGDSYGLVVVMAMNRLMSARDKRATKNQMIVTEHEWPDAAPECASGVARLEPKP